MIRNIILIIAIAAAVGCGSTARADKSLPKAEDILKTAGVAMTPEALVEALKSADPFVRQSAAEVLGTMHVTGAITALKAVLDDGYVYARLAAASSLLKMNDPAGQRVLDEALQGEIHEAVAASRMLAAAGDPRAISYLSGRIANPDATPLDRLLVVRALASYREVAAAKDQVRSILIHILQADDASSVRAGAAEELSQFEGPDVTKAFAGALQKDDPAVKAIARAYLAQHGVK